jgi:hypothetical protein
MPSRLRTLTARLLPLRWWWKLLLLGAVLVVVLIALPGCVTSRHAAQATREEVAAMNAPPAAPPPSAAAPAASAPTPTSQPKAPPASSSTAAAPAHPVTITVSGVSGFVVDRSGRPVDGALITAVHQPTGARAATMTRANGQFSLSGLRVGGPYTITVEVREFQPQRQNDVYLSLNQDQTLNFMLTTEAAETEAAAAPAPPPAPEAPAALERIEVTGSRLPAALGAPPPASSPAVEAPTKLEPLVKTGSRLGAAAAAPPTQPVTPVGSTREEAEAGAKLAAERRAVQEALAHYREAQRIKPDGAEAAGVRMSEAAAAAPGAAAPPPALQRLEVTGSNVPVASAASPTAPSELNREETEAAAKLAAARRALEAARDLTLPARRVKTSEAAEVAETAAPAEPAPPSPLDAMLARTQPANLAYSAPTTMRVNDEATVKLLLSAVAEAKALAKTLAEEAPAAQVHTARARISDDLRFTLSGGDAFKVTSVTSDRQAVSRRESNEWKWTIRALREGKHKLHLAIDAFIGEQPHTIRTLDRDIEVTVAPGAALPSPNLLLIATLVVALAGLVLWRQQHKRSAAPGPIATGPGAIFVSYSRKDEKPVLALVDFLRKRGVPVWLDQHGIDGATLWRQEIVEAIRGCRAVLLAASPAAFASTNVLKEISLASEEHKPILPVYLERAEVPDAFRYVLAGIQHIEWSGGSWEESGAAVLRALERLGGAAGPPKL